MRCIGEFAMASRFGGRVGSLRKWLGTGPDRCRRGLPYLSLIQQFVGYHHV